MTQRERIEALEAAVTALKHQNRLQEELNTRLTEMLCTVAEGGRVNLALTNAMADLMKAAGFNSPLAANDSVQH